MFQCLPGRFTAAVAAVLWLALFGGCSGNAAERPSPASSLQPATNVLRQGEELQLVHSYNISFEEMTVKENGKEVDKNPFRFYTNCFTDAGRMGPAEDRIEWAEPGVVTARDVLEWAGMWHSLEGLARQPDRVLDFSRCYPAFIRAGYQPRCVGLLVRTKGKGHMKLELKSPDNSLLWLKQVNVSSAQFETYRFAVPTDNLRKVKLLNWVVEYGTVSIDEIGFIVQYPNLPIETRTFLKSYAKLARCYDESAGIVRDRANWPAGDFDCVPTSGLFCLATGAAADLGIVDYAFAKDTLQKVHRTIAAVPTKRGVLPHFLRRYDGEYRIHHDTEFSTVDHSLYALSMMLAATILNEPAVREEITDGVRKIDFARLRDSEGRISHGLTDDGTVLPHSWFDWGSETALVLLLERIALGDSAQLRMSSSGRPHNEVGFIPLLCDLFTDRFDANRPDAVTKQNWHQVKRELLKKQQHYFSEAFPNSRAVAVGIYGLSAGEGPNGVGYVANGTALPGIRLIHPHYILLSAPLVSEATSSYKTISVLEAEGLFPPWGLVESVDIALKQCLPMNGSLNASFEAISSYHLRQKHLGEPDAIYAAARECRVFAEAVDGFYPRNE